MSKLATARGFLGANEVLTEWLGPGGAKPGAEQFEEVVSCFPNWTQSSTHGEDLLQGLAFLGRLITVSSWRALDSASKWTTESAGLLFQALETAPYVSLVASWGTANERRFVSNALELLDAHNAQSLIIILCGTETSRNASKATGHHLDCLRRQNVPLARILDEVIICWRRTHKELKVAPTKRLFQFENLSTAIALNKWTQEEIGEPDLALFASAVRTATQDVPAINSEKAKYCHWLCACTRSSRLVCRPPVPGGTTRTRRCASGRLGAGPCLATAAGHP